MKTAAAVGCLAFSVSVASAQEITAIDFNGDLIGKVIPDGKVVSFENQLIGNITADSLIVNFEGSLIGGVVPKGIAIGNDNRLLGKVNNDAFRFWARCCFPVWFIPTAAKPSVG